MYFDDFDVLRNIFILHLDLLGGPCQHWAEHLMNRSSQIPLSSYGFVCQQIASTFTSERCYFFLYKASLESESFPQIKIDDPYSGRKQGMKKKQ